MTEETAKQTLREAVLGTIKSGGARMLPRWRFALKTALALVGVFLLTLALLSSLSFGLFILRHTGLWFVPVFGFRGVRALLFSFPWLLVAVGIALIILLETILRRFAFAYRKPLIVSLAGILVFAGIASALISRSHLHERLFLRNRQGRPPFTGEFYRGYGLSSQRNVHIGRVATSTPEGFLMENPLGETLSIVITPKTRFPLGADFETRDHVVVLGDREDGTVQAFGVRRIDDETRRFSGRRGGEIFFRRRPMMAK